VTDVPDVPDVVERPSRRATDGGPADSPRARQGRLVRHIRSDRVLVEWLATSKARTLHTVAAQLSAAGHKEAADMVSRHAVRLATGEVSPF
jgi:hypothetical protein